LEGTVTLQLTPRGILVHSQHRSGSEEHSFLRYHVEHDNLAIHELGGRLLYRMESRLLADGRLIVRDDGRDWEYARGSCRQSFDVSSALIDVIVFAIDHGLARMEEEPRLTPFLLSEAAGERAFLGFDDPERKNAVAEARRWIVMASERIQCCALVYDGYMTVGSKQRDALFAETYERGQDRGALFVQPYEPKQFLRPFHRVGSVDYCGACEALL